MKVIKAHYEIITPINGEEILKQIELAARTCYKSEYKINSIIKCNSCKVNSVTDCTKPSYIQNYCLGKGYNDKPIGLPSHIELIYNKLLANNHSAMLEFGGMITVKFIVDRGVSHELVRHRLASFAQESTRYCNYNKEEDIIFIQPCWITDISNDNEDVTNWYDAMCESEDRYNNFISLGWSPQQARSVLPTSLKTEINVSCNIREWREIFKQRTSNAAHPQMQEVMRPLLNEFKQLIPILFDDINY